MLYFYCSTCSGKGERGMLSTKRWNFMFKILCGILSCGLVFLIFFDSNFFDLLYFSIIIMFIFGYLVDKKLK